MEKFSDILRRLADMLDADFQGNMKAVVSELASVFSYLSRFHKHTLLNKEAE